MMLRQKVPKVKIKRLATKGVARKLQFTDLPNKCSIVSPLTPDGGDPGGRLPINGEDIRTLRSPPGH